MDTQATIVSVFAEIPNEHAPIVGAFVAGAAFFEHIFPPVPGDLGVALGMALAFAKGWNPAVMFLCAMIGSITGSTVSFAFGHWLSTHDPSNDGPRIARVRAGVKPAIDLLVRRGEWAVVLSRFVPVGRALVLVAAGYGRMPRVRTLLAAIAGGALWNGVLLLVAAALGTQYERIGRMLSAYGRVVYVLLALGVVAWLVSLWRRKGRRAVTP